jgi:ketosteroid isomerase-like protein
VHIEGGQTVSHDRSSVEAVVQHYFDALYEGDADKLGAVFHPSADLRSLEKGELKVLTMPVLVRFIVSHSRASLRWVVKGLSAPSRSAQ